MNPYKFFKTKEKEEVARVAKGAGTTFEYFQQIAHGHRRPSYGLAKRLVGASNGELDLTGLLEAKDYKRPE